MINIVWEYQVKEIDVPEFENTYGKNGDWVNLFSKSKHYYGTTLLKKSESDCHRYLTIDSWNSIYDFENFKLENEKDYKILDLRCNELTLHESLVGIYEEK